MEYILEIRFNDENYNAIIHFVTTFNVVSEEVAGVFEEELIQGFARNGAEVLHSSCHRIDNNPELKERQYEYFKFYLSRATASIKLEQFSVESPDQSKSLAENLMNKFFAGEDSTAIIGGKYKLPVRVMEKGSRNPIGGDIFYYSIEQLIPKE